MYGEVKVLKIDKNKLVARYCGSFLVLHNKFCQKHVISMFMTNNVALNLSIDDRF
jgi:hypothetical protein